MTNEVKNAVNVIKEYLALDKDIEGNEYLDSLRVMVQALESQQNLTNEELYQSFIKLEAENERLHDALEAQRWIPVSERLPKTRDEVLIFLANGQITIASYNDHVLPFFDKSIGWQVDVKRFVFYFCSDDVIAWMPLPEPYVPDTNVGEMEVQE